MAENAQSLRNLSVGALEEKLKELSEQRFTLRFRNSMRQIENPLIVRENRKDIARVMTVLNEKRRESADS